MENGSVIWRHPCRLHFRSDLVPYTMVVVVECLFNLLVVVAIAFNRSKLKHNHVYCYVTSVLTANMALGLLFTYTLVNYMIAFERNHSPAENVTHRYDQDDRSQTSIMTWWAFRKAFMVAFFLILSGNVSALIHGIADSAYFVGRSGGSNAKLRLRLLSTSSSSSSRCESHGEALAMKKRRAYVIISITWILPFIYSLPAAFGWNCIKHCDCMPGYYGGYRCISRTDAALCSRVWSPMNNVHLLLAAIIWFVELIIIGVNLFYALHKYYRTSVRPAPHSTGERGLDESTVSAQTAPPPTTIHKRSIDKAPATTTKAMLTRPMHPTVKLLILISVAYVMATVPVMVCVVTDFVGATSLGATLVSDMVMTAVSSLVVLYCFACPVILIAYMPGLRSAIVRLLMPCSCTSTKVTATFIRGARVSERRSSQRRQASQQSAQ